MRRPTDTSKYFRGLFSRLYEKKVTPVYAETEMSRVLGGERVYIQGPPSHKRERVMKALARGDGVHAVAERYGLSERHVRRLRKKLESGE